MEKDNHVEEVDGAIRFLMEDTMDTVTEPLTVHPAKRTNPTDPCTHSRMIDDVLTRSKKRTGKVRCLECQAVIDDPYQAYR